MLDKNGEELQDVMIKSITNEEQGVVELLPGVRHKFEDGDEVLLRGVEGMALKPGEKHDDQAVKSASINDTIHKVTVLTPSTFKIGDTRKFEKYERNGIAKQLKTKVSLSFKTYQEAVMGPLSDIPLDGNLAISDFEKISHNQAAHICFAALEKFRAEHSRLPLPWNLDDAEQFVASAKQIAAEGKVEADDLKDESSMVKLFYLFAFQCRGVLNPLCAFMGGFVAQEVIKAITHKFTPTNQLFYYDATEVLPDFDPVKHIKALNPAQGDTAQSVFAKTYVDSEAQTGLKGDRYDGLRIVVGQKIVDKLARMNLFMVGAGAIGCELLKNYAMLGVGCGKKDEAAGLKAGSIVLTDPDVIEVSNLNRQFLFREKHLRKPKSATAAAAAIQMNPQLKGNIIARLDKVHPGSAHIFTDSFFESLSLVTNALDNVAARKYVDLRCISAKTPLLESGTLGPKGHVQVILPYLTESYGSQ